MGRSANKSPNIKISNEVTKAANQDHTSIENLIESVEVGLFKLDTLGKFEYTNNYVSKITGIPKSQFKDIYWLSFLDMYSDSTIAEEARSCFLEKKNFIGEGTLKCNGRSCWCTFKVIPEYQDSKLIGYAGTVANISHIKTKRGKLEKLALQDSLTGLPNRRFFEQTLIRVLENAKRNKTKFALLYLDLDNLKKVNDTFGHIIGDELLKEVSNRLRKISRSSELLARLSGDEFTLIVENITNNNSLIKIIKRVNAIFKESFNIKKNNFSTSTSIGIAVYPDSSTDPHELQLAADHALYKAKSNGKNTYELFNDELKSEIERQNAIESELANAIANKEIYLAYQPQVDVLNNKIIAIEVLARWKNKNIGEVSPNEFIRIAEETGKIHEIGDWIFDTAIKDFNRWKSKDEDYFEDVKISFNLSSIQLISHDLTKKIDYYLSKYNLDPSHIIIELNEASVMQNPTLVKSVLDNLSSLGVKVAIDDFGKGYSSLNSLNDYPFKLIKIDRNLIKSGINEKSSSQLIAGVIHLAKALGLKIVGVGIETEEQMEYLKENNCDYLQGHIISKPLSANELDEFISNKKN